MNEDDRICEVERQIELLKKDNEIMQANIDATLKSMQANIDTTLNAMRAEASKRDAEAAKRETRLILTIVGLLVAGLTIQSFILN